MSKRALHAFINESQIGTLWDENNIWAFEYTQEWASNPKGFDLSPALPRQIDGKAGIIVDGSSNRPVQWYFDNLLPEEALRTVLAGQAELDENDAFGLLAYYGLESAGSLTLFPDGSKPVKAGIRKLPLSELSERIKAMPKVPLNADSPKHMSLAGAQHKLAVIYKDGELFEPDGPTASTHILKPQHPDKTAYPASVVNEYLIMRVAREIGLPVPAVHRLFCPEPVYIIERFDRLNNTNGTVERLHVIDACQLLNHDRLFKYSGARVDTMLDLIKHLKVPATARQWFFDWLVFNMLIGNSDNHLKNLSFMVDHNGIVISPCYDLLCTAAYDTSAVNPDQGHWPATELAFKLNRESKTFNDITRKDVVAAGELLGLNATVTNRRMDNLIRSVPEAIDRISQQIQEENNNLPEDIKREVSYDARMLLIIQKLILPDTLKFFAA
jgi:serine/threonine-protein kinase HipA